MKTYELTYIISPETTSEEIEAKAKEIESLIQSKEGTILKQLNPIAKTLSYPINKRASGFLGVLEFHLEPEKLLEFKEAIVKDKKIVRHMLIIKEAAELRRKMRTRTKTAPVIEIESKPEVEEKPAHTASHSDAGIEEEPVITKKPKDHESKPKVDLKDIEHELDEILGE